MNSQKTILFILVALAAWSCRQKELSTAELTAFIQDEKNGLRKTVVTEGITVEVTYRPTDMLVQQQLGNQPSDTAQIRKLRAKYAPYYYFILSLSRNGKEALVPSAGSYSELVQTISFKMGEYITLSTDGGEVIPVADTNLNRTYGLAVSTDVLVVFERKKTLGTEWIQFNLNEFGLGIGNQRFRFKTSDIQYCPNVIFLTSH